jgi:hypothetical protein
MVSTSHIRPYRRPWPPACRSEAQFVEAALGNHRGVLGSTRGTHPMSTLFVVTQGSDGVGHVDLPAGLHSVAQGPAHIGSHEPGPAVAVPRGSGNRWGR